MKLILAVALALALAFPAGAHPCTTWSTSHPEIDTTGGGGWFYIDNDLCQVPPGHPAEWPAPGLYGDYFPFPGWDHDGDGDADGCLFSIWYYEESNGVPGLQRGDEMVDDTCHGMIWADTILF